LNRAEAYAAIEANRDKLDGCKRHRFPAEVPGIENGPGAMFGQKIRCLECGGAMDLVALNYYVRGYEAAGGNGNDVLPGWREEGTTSDRRYFGEDKAG
jgi:hypothetical protein